MKIPIDGELVSAICSEADRLRKSPSELVNQWIRWRIVGATKHLSNNWTLLEQTGVDLNDPQAVLEYAERASRAVNHLRNAIGLHVIESGESAPQVVRGAMSKVMEILGENDVMARVFKKTGYLFEESAC